MGNCRVERVTWSGGWGGVGRRPYLAWERSLNASSDFSAGSPRLSSLASFCRLALLPACHSFWPVSEGYAKHRGPKSCLCVISEGYGGNTWALVLIPAPLLACYVALSMQFKLSLSFVIYVVGLDVLFLMGCLWGVKEVMHVEHEQCLASAGALWLVGSMIQHQHPA